MEPAKFRELLVIAKEFNVSAFKKGGLEVHFTMGHNLSEISKQPDIKDEPDEDEIFIKKLAEMKAQSAMPQS